MRHAAIGLAALVALSLGARTADAQGLSHLAAHVAAQLTGNGGWDDRDDCDVHGHVYYHRHHRHHGYHRGYHTHHWWGPPVYVYPRVYGYSRYYGPYGSFRYYGHGGFHYYGPRLGISIGF
jgi:hypothetical protein